jgi:hypothetical protein
MEVIFTLPNQPQRLDNIVVDMPDSFVPIVGQDVILDYNKSGGRKFQTWGKIKSVQFKGITQDVPDKVLSPGNSIFDEEVVRRLEKLQIWVQLEVIRHDDLNPPKCDVREG